MENIKASIGTYTFAEKEKLKMCAPIAVYLNENYPKQHIKYFSATAGTAYNFNSYPFVKASYQGIGDNIFFQIFPIGNVDESSVNDFKLMKDYTSLHQNYKQYPSMTLNPNGNLMTAPVLFDALDPFLNNGIFFSDGKQKDKADAAIFGDGDASASSCINWKVDFGRFDAITDTYNPQAASLFTPLTSGVAGYMSNTKGNMGSRKIMKAQKKQKSYSYIQGIASKYLGNEYDPKTHTASQYASKRVYKLSNYGVNNPLEAALGAVSDDDYSDKFLEDMSTAKPFLFIINFSNNQDVSANLDFGYNRVQITPNQLFLTVSDQAWYSDRGVITKTIKARQGHENRAQCSSVYDKNTRAPFFYRGCNGLNGWRSNMFIVYPTYCGIAIQPGIHFPNNLQSSKQSPVLRAVGSVVQLPVENKRRVPTFQAWIQLQKNKYKLSDTDNSDNVEDYDGNVFLQPNRSQWDTTSDLRLTINNGTANFFYMPLYFVSKCRFRMYFKGIKGGKYDDTGMPYEDTYIKKSQQSSKNCTQEASIQYKTETTTSVAQDGSKTETVTYTSFAAHTYYGSLIYTTDYGQSDNTAVGSGNINSSTYAQIQVPSCSYITAPVTSYRIPPGENDKSFWDKYSMDGYYMDFTIQLKDQQEEDSSENQEEKLPFVRHPLQVLGVLIMQVTTYEKSMLDNKNGTFNVSQSVVYQATSSDSGELPITSNSSLTSNSWVQYIQNISTSWSQEGGSGSITLDKYALMGQQVLPQQCIGGLSISMSGGNPQIIKCSSSSTFTEQTRSSIFTGFGTKLSASDSFSQDTITITLQGPQRKLTDMKLINPPFWDGDKLETAYQWLANYCGLDIVYNDQYFSEQTSFNCAAANAKKYVDQNGVEQERDQSSFPMLPTSSNFKRPAIYIKTGQDSFSVLKMLAEKCNCRFVLQPDGKAYVMTQTKMAVPQMCDQTSNSGGRGTSAGYTADFDQNLVLSYSVQPLLNNLHNYIISASYKSANIGNKAGQSTGSLQAGFKVNKKFRKLKTSPEIPWSKVKAFKHQGFMSQSDVQAQFERDIYMVSCYWLSVKVTIPGNQTIWIYDKVKMFGIDYYVMQVSHNIDLVGKKWTTQLTLSNILKDPSTVSTTPPPSN